MFPRTCREFALRGVGRHGLAGMFMSGIATISVSPGNSETKGCPKPASPRIKGNYFEFGIILKKQKMKKSTRRFRLVLSALTLPQVIA